MCRLKMETNKAHRKILPDCLLIHPCAGQKQLGTIQFLITNKLHDPCFIPLFLSLSLGSKTRSVQNCQPLLASLQPALSN